jgi:hypothetical protein
MDMFGHGVDVMIKPRKDDLDEFVSWLKRYEVSPVDSTKIQPANWSLEGLLRERQTPDSTEVRGDRLFGVRWGDLFVCDFGDYRLTYGSN